VTFAETLRGIVSVSLVTCLDVYRRCSVMCVHKRSCCVRAGWPSR